MNTTMRRRPALSSVASVIGALTALFFPAACGALDLVGLSVTPHNQSPNMRYRRAPDPQLGARVEIFLRHEGQAPLTLAPDFPARFDGRTPAELLTNGDCAWHDTPAARSNESIVLPPGALTVWSFNSRGTNWGAGTVHQLQDGQPSWDLASVTGPNGALFFANDLAYRPDVQEKVFQFTPREGVFTFRLPAYLPNPAEVFRLDADGPQDVTFSPSGGQITIQDRVSVAGIYVAAPAVGLRQRVQARHAELLQFEHGFDFNPAAVDSDFNTLRQLLP